MTGPPDVSAETALVVFSGKADLRWLRLLRPGFRHCFVLLQRPQGWLCVNPLAHRLVVEVWPVAEAGDLAAGLAAQPGLTVVVTKVRIPPRRPCPIGIFSCVEAVKRSLGLHARWVVTPGQLHDHLTRCGKKSLTYANTGMIVRKSTPEPCPDHPSIAVEPGGSAHQ